MDKEYFASLPTDKVGDKLVERTQEYYKYVRNSGHYDLWKSVHEATYKGFFTKGEILQYGKQGEKSKLTVNHFSSILQHIKVLTTDQRPVFDPKAANSDYKSASQVILARGLLDYFMRQENLEEVVSGCVDIALQAGEAYIFQEWNPDLGKIVGELEEDEVENEEPEPGDAEDAGVDPPASKIKREGNIFSVSLHPLDIARDIHKDTTENNEWYIVRQRVNKFDLAARYPRFSEDIINNEIENAAPISISLRDYDQSKFVTSDQIYKFVFRHKKTAAVPEGRQVEFLSDGTVFFDSELPYSDISIYRLMPLAQKNTNFGYTVAFDMLAIQDMADQLNSTIVTNQRAFGVTNIIAQKGSGVTASNLTGGLKLIEYSGDPQAKPAPLDLLSTPLEIFNFKKELVQDMETISGINSVSRGNPEASLRSGSSLALVQSMAIQFNSGLQQSYAMMLENVGTGVISMLKDYASAPRVALIAGISKKSYLREFKGEDLSGIERVIVDMGNPMSKTLAGRMQIADNLVERGLIKSPEQYIQLMETGRLDPLLEGETAELMNIRSENEKLANGEDVFALYTDNHWLHIKEHKTVLSSPDAREVREIIIITDNHIKKHIEMLRTTDPGILMILGQQPIPSPVNSEMGGQPVPAIPNQPMEDTPVQGQAGTPPSGGAEAPPSGMGTTGIQGVNMPSQPKNPLTDQQFNTTTGGL